MNDKEKIQDELKESPFLKDLKDQGEGFEIPFKYFDGLSEEVMDKIHSQKSKGSVLNSWFNEWLGRVFYPQFALKMATVSGVVILLFVLFFPGQDQDNLVADNDITSETIQDYILANLEDFDTDLFTNMLDETDEIPELFEVDIPSNELDEMLEELIEDIDYTELEELL